LKWLQQEGVTGVGLCWTFFMQRVQPLKARAHPLFQYAGPTDPTRESKADLPWSEVKAWVVSVLKTGINIEETLNNHPSPRSLAHNPQNIYFLPFPSFSSAINADPLLTLILISH
ncbi:hypothetical protein BAE44_0011593, partial [Dichanthelium oligosanthes]